MKLVKDSAGAYYKANSKSCCGCGYDQQSRDESAPDAGGLGNPDRRGKPPVLDDGSSNGGGFLSWLFGG